ncbi:unnamed protein product [Prorocentrum cordatum]|uniref:Uncharacterized protein n=1 Tax=Prorocentrum cordatum TaxID=2364126 RepID=A0ABN9UYB6_9DINO|nr:unnamed protein product [Polarella glacialis]
MDAISQLMVQVEEANALCGELARALPSMLPVELDVGMTFSFQPGSRPPAVIVQVWARRPAEDPGPPRLVAAWPPAEFDHRLVGLRDAHREAGPLPEEGLGGGSGV